jgi:molecular chaperone DnaJ
MTAAALGTQMTLKSLDGEENVEVKPGTQPGATIKIKSKGVPRLRGGGRGDLFVHLDVKTPTRLDAEQEKLLKELSKLRGEETIEPARPGGGFFSRMRDAFNGHA